MFKAQLIYVEDNILVDIEEEIVVRLQFALPFVETEEAVAEDNDGGDVVFSDLGDRLLRPCQDAAGVEIDHPGFVDDAVHRNDILVPRLCEELGELVVHVQCALCIHVTVGPVEPPDYALSSGMVPAVLGSGCAVEIEIYSKAVLSRVFNTTKEVPPSYLFDVGVAAVGSDSPISEGNAYVVEPGSADVYKSLLGDEGGVVLFKC